MICKECGCPYKADLPSCPECGCPNDSAASATEAKADSMLCPYCGAPVDGLKICPWCGKPLVEGMEQEEYESISSDACNPAEEEVEQTKDESTIVSETPLSDNRNDTSSSSVDRNNKKPSNPWRALLPLAGVSLVVLIGMMMVRSGTDDRKKTDVESNVEPISSRASGQHVYSCAYDGFVNMRDAASYSAAKIGEFRNGPEGAILLEEVGDWVKIDVNGLEGFVPSKYVREKPTVAYTGDITIDWLEGMWSSNGGHITNIFNNGTYEHGYDYPTEMGTYMMQNKDEIVFTPLWILDDDTDNAERFKDYTLKITNRTGKEMTQFQDDYLTLYHQMKFMTQKELDEYGDESWSDGMMTISTFRSLGRNVLKRIEEIEKKK